MTNTIRLCVTKCNAIKYITKNDKIISLQFCNISCNKTIVFGLRGPYNSAFVFNVCLQTVSNNVFGIKDLN